MTVQATARMRSKAFRHAEDAKMLNAQVGDPPLAKRGQDVLRNGLENEPIFVLLLWALFEVAGTGDAALRETADAAPWVDLPAERLEAAWRPPLTACFEGAHSTAEGASHA